jgi:hypothetical protein
LAVTKCRCPPKQGNSKGHHIREWVRDRGPTDLYNLVLLCHHHHHLAHEGGWTITGKPGKDLTFHPPGRPPTAPPPDINPIRRT